MKLNPNIVSTDAPAIVEAYRWLDETELPPDLPFINVSQAAPAVAPPLALREYMADAVMNDTSAHLYGPDLGLPALREALAQRTAKLYGGSISAEQVAITSGCNQAFSAVIASLVAEGEEVILPTPWYFNHQMWLTMNGKRPIALPTDDNLMPNPEEAALLITDKTRAIALVSPNNPCGTEYPPALIRAFYELCKSNGIALILDETYRDFLQSNDPAHSLFQDEDWADTLVHLYSFSKAYRLTGHRVGAIITSETRLAEIEKFIDSTTICASALGQRAALWGLENLTDWLAGERAEILDRRAAVTEMFANLPGWHLKGCGAYFAFVEYDGSEPSDVVAKRLLAEQAVLALPASMFTPKGDPRGKSALRIAFANIDRAGIAQLHKRLNALSLAP